MYGRPFVRPSVFPERILDPSIKMLHYKTSHIGTIMNNTHVIMHLEIT